ncbi:MAG: hypothetical protein U5K79_15000 [Cyclobacteriaceae bacterium]|nr:hypothetical protein [Cyclobacteriaceae bacterium]
MKKIQLKIPLILPEVPDERRCVNKLIQKLPGKRRDRKGARG